MVGTDSCKLSLDDGTHFDLSSLSNAQTDYETIVGQLTYKLNPCRNVVTELWHLPDGSDPDVGGVVRREAGDFSIGSSTHVNLTMGPNGVDPILVLENGSPCVGSEGTVLASTAIRFICDPTEFGAGKPQLISALPISEPDNACSFFFEWKTHVACPTNVPVTLGGHWTYITAFITLLLIAILSLLIGATIYNRFILGLRGFDQLPRPSFSLPSLSNPFKRPQEVGLPTTSDTGASKSWFSWRRPRSRFAGYNHIRAEEDEEEDALTDGRFSLEEDEAEEDARALPGSDPTIWRDVRSNGLNSGLASNKGRNTLVSL